MIDLDFLYYEWLLSCINPDEVLEGVAYVGDLLHNCDFKRRVGNDINRAIDGANLRKEFLAKYEEAEFEPHVTNDLATRECSWFEMLVALARAIDYLYEGGVEGRFIELICNMRLEEMLNHGPHRAQDMREYDQKFVDRITGTIDDSLFEKDGYGGLFPLSKPGHPNQRRVELWDQQAAYFNERLEGVLWTSIN